MQKRPPSSILIIGIVAAIAVMVGLNNALAPRIPGVHEHEEEPPAAAEQQAEKKAPPPPPMPPAPVKKGKQPVMVIMETDRGTIKVKLFTDDMPVTTKNFIDLVERKFYDGLTFHRVEDWVVQGGDPTATGTGGSGKTIPLEINKKQKWNKAGLVGMARTNDPNSATSQFFFVTKPTPFLDPGGQSAGYACFGEVVQGLDVVKAIQKGDKIKQARIEQPAAAETKPPASAPPASQ